MSLLTSAACPHCLHPLSATATDTCSICGRYFGPYALSTKQAQRKRDRRDAAARDLALEIQANALFRKHLSGLGLDS
jgi:hypothetical protein